MEIATIFGLIFLTCIFIALGVFNKYPIYRWVNFSFAFFEIIIILAVLNLASSNLDYSSLLSYNMYLVMIIGLGAFILSLVSKSLVLMSFDEKETANMLGEEELTRFDKQGRR